MFEWLAIMSPVVFGFGSLAVINVAHAGLKNEEHGITHAIPSLLGTHLVYAAYALIIGFTYGWIILTFPVLLMIMKYASVAILALLAYMIWSRDKAISEENYLSFVEEFIIQAVRPAIPLMMVVMYSVFLDVTRPLALQVIAMTVGLVILSFITQVFWLIAGMVLDHDVFSGKMLKALDRSLAVVYGLLAIWLVIL